MNKELGKILNLIEDKLVELIPEIKEKITKNPSILTIGLSDYLAELSTDAANEVIKDNQEIVDGFSNEEIELITSMLGRYSNVMKYALLERMPPGVN
jgi:hypothetical protein